MAKVWVFAEVGPDGPAPAALELLAKARELGDAEAVALGPGAIAAAGALGDHGARTVFASDDPVYDEFLAQPAAHAMHALVQEHAPDLILFATTYASRDVAGRLQAKTGTALMSNAIDVASVDRARTQIAGGTLFVDVELDGPAPHLVLVRPKSFVAEPAGGTAEVVPVDVEIPRSSRRPAASSATRNRRRARSSRRPRSSSPADAGCRKRRTSACWISSPRRSATPPSGPVAPSSTRAGSRTATRSDRRARR